MRATVILIALGACASPRPVSLTCPAPAAAPQPALVAPQRDTVDVCGALPLFPIAIARIRGDERVLSEAEYRDLVDWQLTATDWTRCVIRQRARQP